jgi:AhpD family alkylhydroperoxidase
LSAFKKCLSGKDELRLAQFKKRIYRNPWAFLQDLGFIVKNLGRVYAIFRGQSISPAFRERMMLAVTRVNDCRLCAYLHTKAALSEGISREEIDAFLGGEFKDCPAGEIAGVLYAEHWAETTGQVDAEMREKLVAAYGQAAVNDIDVVLRIIKTGNFTNNTLDYLLYRISFGRWGVT